MADLFSNDPPPETAVELEMLVRSLTDRISDKSGSALIGFDGSLLASCLPAEIDSQCIADCSLRLFENSRQLVDQIDQGNLISIASVTQQGYVFNLDFGGGLLVIWGSNPSPDLLSELMRGKKP